MFHKYTVIEHSLGDIEVRSSPILVWLIEQWFFWVHEWMYWVNKDWHYKYMYPFCRAYDNMIMPWVFKHERIVKVKTK
jgi:hypothetical protein